MLFVNNQNITDPRVNLAIEEHLLRHVQVEEPLLLFYINKPSVIIGRNQNTIQEIDQEFVKAQGIHVVRRLSGGGAVYHDLGNLNFSFVTNGRDHLHDFARFTEPVVLALNKLGVKAELRGQSDIFADGKKISGNAQYAAGGRMFSHGTLLFNTNLENLLKALNPSQVEITTKAVQSIRSFVGNIHEFVPRDMSIAQLKKVILEEVFGENVIPTYQLTGDDWLQINEISESRYRTWEWNIGRSPQFNIHNEGRFDGVGKIEVFVDVENGHVRQIKFYGDFSGEKNVADLEMQLVGLRYDVEALNGALERTNMADYFGPITPGDFIKTVCPG